MKQYDITALETPIVYLLRADKWCKIGVTKYLDRRLKQLGTKPPFHLQCLHVINTTVLQNEEHIAYDAESELHQLYNAKRVRGEWFGLSSNDILDIMVLDQWNWMTKQFESNGSVNSAAYRHGFKTCLLQEPASTNPFARHTKCHESWQAGFLDMLLILWESEQIRDSGFASDIDETILQQYKGRLLCPPEAVVCALLANLPVPSRD